MSTTRAARTDSTAHDDVTLDVITAVADLLGADPVDIDPLHGSVDTDALAALYADGSGPRVEFRTNGCRVVVEHDGAVVAHRLADD